MVAIIGINTWRRELRGRANYELSRKLVIICRKLQAEFKWAIFPVTTSDEYADRPSLEEEPSEISKLLNLRWAKWRRLKPIIEHLSELQELAW